MSSCDEVAFQTEADVNSNDYNNNDGIVAV